MKQKVLYAIIAVLAVAAIVFGVLYFTNDADKTAQIDKLTGEKTALTDDVNGKAGQIETLEGEKTQLIADHEKAIGEKDAEINKLTGEKEALEKEKAQLIADHETAIAALETTVADLESRINAAAPVAETVMDEELVGVWIADIQALMETYDLLEEEYESVKEAIEAMEFSIEFTADGMVIMRSVMNGEDIVEPTIDSYKIPERGRMLYGGVESTYTIDGDNLTIVENGISMQFTRK